MVDIEKGWLVAEDVADRLAVPVAVVRNWMRKGRPVGEGDPVKLHSIYIGLERVTREEWLADFLARTAPTKEPTCPT